MSAGATIPHEAPPVSDTAIWHELSYEMSLAGDTSRSGLAAAWMHVSSEGTDQAGFHTKLQPGPMTDLVKSAATIAQLDLLKHASALFAWTLDTEHVSSLRAQAVQLNQAAAQPLQN